MTYSCDEERNQDPNRKSTSIEDVLDDEARREIDEAREDNDEDEEDES